MPTGTQPTLEVYSLWKTNHLDPLSSINFHSNGLSRSAWSFQNHPLYPLYAKVQKRSKTEPTLTREDITGYQLRIAPPDKLPLAPKQQEDEFQNHPTSSHPLWEKNQRPSPGTGGRPRGNGWIGRTTAPSLLRSVLPKRPRGATEMTSRSWHRCWRGLLSKLIFSLRKNLK